MVVFLNKNYNNRYYTNFDGKLYNVYLEDEKQSIKLLTAKNGTKYFVAELVAKHGKDGKFYFIAKKRLEIKDGELRE